MISEEIKNIKSFMNHLLIEDTFDNFLITDVNITTFNTFTIDGHINKSFYTNEEYEELSMPEISSWHTLKPFCFQIIKGKKTPSYFRFIFKMPELIVNELIASNNLDISNDNIQGLFLNIKYENSTLTYTTGCALKIFDVSKETEKAYDKYISKYIDSIFC